MPFHSTLSLVPIRLPSLLPEPACVPPLRLCADACHVPGSQGSQLYRGPQAHLDARMPQPLRDEHYSVSTIPFGSRRGSDVCGASTTPAAS